MHTFKLILIIVILCISYCCCNFSDIVNVDEVIENTTQLPNFEDQISKGNLMIDKNSFKKILIERKIWLPLFLKSYFFHSFIEKF